MFFSTTLLTVLKEVPVPSISVSVKEGTVLIDVPVSSAAETIHIPGFSLFFNAVPLESLGESNKIF